MESQRENTNAKNVLEHLYERDPFRVWYKA